MKTTDQSMIMIEEEKGISLAALWNKMPAVVQVYFLLFVVLMMATIIVWVTDCCVPHGGGAGGHGDEEAHHLFPIFGSAFTAAFGAVIGALSQWAGKDLGRESR